MSYRPPEPRLARLADLLEDRLSPDDSALVQQQVHDGGRRAEHALRWTTEFLALAAAVPLHPAPPGLRERVAGTFRAHREADAALADTPIEVTLALLFDSTRDLELAGTRSAAQDDDVVHLAFSSERADLVLDIFGTGLEAIRVAGQILPLEPGAAVAHVTLEGPGGPDGPERRSTTCDSHGRFSFEGAHPGRHRLRAGDGRFVLVADLDLRDPRSTDASRGAR